MVWSVVSAEYDNFSGALTEVAFEPTSTRSTKISNRLLQESIPIDQVIDRLTRRERSCLCLSRTKCMMTTLAVKPHSNKRYLAKRILDLETSLLAIRNLFKIGELFPDEF